MRVGFKVVLGVLMLGIALQGAPVRADEIADQLKEGLEAYQKGDYRRAVEVLNFSVGQIQQQMASKLKDAFPQPLAGWKAEDAASQYGGVPFLAQGVSASRRYFTEDGGKEVYVEFVSDSPLLQAVLMFFSNPAIVATQPNMKLVKVKGRSAVQKFAREDREGEINVVIGSRLLVTVKGQNLDKPDDVQAYADAVRYDLLEKFLQN